MGPSLRRAALVLVSIAALASSADPKLESAVERDGTAQSPAKPQEVHCTVDLTLPGVMRDILSNVLDRSIERPSPAEFLNRAVKECVTGDELLRATAQHFVIDEAVLAAEVERFRHINCTHPPVADPRYMPPDSSRPENRENAAEGASSGERVELSAFARDVALHVVLHELGHALVREFDLPILGNEETMADAFATHYLTTHMPDRAVDVLMARTTSLMIEAREVPRAEWPVSGEHDSDARRAFQIAALAVAADATKYEAVAQVVGMSAEDLKKARDYGAEIHRSWRRILSPLWMPHGALSTEARVARDPDDPTFDQTSASELLAELEAVIAQFDWHSQVTIRFSTGDGGAAWSRSQRTITVHDGYLRRFVEQGKAAAAHSALGVTGGQAK